MPAPSDGLGGYLRRPDWFARDAFGAKLLSFQAEALRGLGLGHRVAIRSGNGPGKTTTAAMAIAWGLLVARAIVPCTAPTRAQLEHVLFPEVRRWVDRSPELARHLEFSQGAIRLGGDPGSFAVARVGRTKESQAGFHGSRLLYVIDEAAGVPDHILAMVDGALSTPGARCLMVGNPTRPSGYFADAFGRNAEQWQTITVSSAEVSVSNPGRVSPAWVAAMAAEWGEGHDVYRTQVLGLPPLGEALGFIPYHLVQAAQDRYDDTEPDGPLVVGVDVARYGADASAVVARRGFKPLYCVARRGLGVDEVSAWVAQVVWDLVDEGESATVWVDDDGIGGGVTDLLTRMARAGTLSAGVSGASFGGKGDKHFATNAGVWWSRIRRLMQEGRLALPPDQDLSAQLTNRTAAVNLAAKTVLEQKDKMRGRGAPSPDKADALALAFSGTSLEDWEGVYSIVACDRCGHKYVNPKGDRPCPECREGYEA